MLTDGSHNQTYAGPDRWTDTNCENNLAKAASYNPGFNRLKHLRVRVREPKMGIWTNPNFKSNQALVMSYHPVQFQVDQTKRLRVSLETKLFQMSACPKQANGPIPILKATKPWVCPYHPVKFQIDRQKCLRVRVQKQNFTMAANLFSNWHQL